MNRPHPLARSLPAAALALGAALAPAAPAAAKTADEIVRAGTPEEKGQEVARELAARNAGYKDLGGEVEMTLRDAGGAEARRGVSLKVLERPGPDAGDYSLIVFDSPADVKGVAVLSHPKADGEDDQWLYLPSAKKVKRVAAANRGGAFVGSEFSFEDLTGSDARKYAWRLAGEAPCGAEQCLVVETTPKDPASAYSKRVLKVERGEFRVASIDFFDKKGAKLKTLTYGDYRKLNGKYWRAHTWTMKNDQTGKSTVVRFSSMRLATGLTPADFAPGKLGG